MAGKTVSLSHLFGAARHSFAGLLRAWREEHAFRHEVFVLIALFILLLITEKSFTTIVTVLGCWLIVMAIELLNSAVESAFDLISKEFNDRIKAGKDMASAAIFLAIVANAGLWIVVFFGIET